MSLEPYKITKIYYMDDIEVEVETKPKEGTITGVTVKDYRINRKAELTRAMLEALLEALKAENPVSLEVKKNG